MLIKKLKKCQKFIAGDKSILKELLHPKKQSLKIRYSLAHATLKRGEKSIPHKLKTSEVYYIINGKGIMYIDKKSSPVSKDTVIYIPPNSVQHIENSGKSELKFLCIVDPAWRKKDEIVL